MQRNWRKTKNSFICITGYQDEESPGRKLQELCNESEQEKQWIINSNNVKFNCKTGTYSLSAHADKNELINIVEHMKPKEVFFSSWRFCFNNFAWQ